MIRSKPYSRPSEFAHRQGEHLKGPVISSAEGSVRPLSRGSIFVPAPAEIFIDSGADVTVIGKRFVAYSWVVALPINVHGRVPVEIQLHRLTRPVTIETAVIESPRHPKPGPEDVLLGRDFLNQFMLVLDGPLACFSIVDIAHASPRTLRNVERARKLLRP